MSETTSRPRPLLVAAVGTYLAAYAAWQLEGWGGPGAKALIGDLAFVPVYGGAAAMAWQASRRCARVPRLRSAWRLIAIGVSFYFLGILFQSYYEIVASSKPFPSLADPAYLMFYPFALAGLLRFPHTRETRWQRIRTLTDCATVAVAGSALVWYVFGPVTAVNGTRHIETVVSIAAPIGDLMLIVGLATALFRRVLPASLTALRLIATGLVFFVAADLTYGWMSLHSSYSGGDPVDTLYIVALSLFLIGAASQRVPTSAGHLSHGDSGRGARWAPWVGVITALGLLAIHLGYDDLAAGGGLDIAAVAVVLLVVARQLLSQRDLLDTHEELERAHRELAALAVTDPVTMLPNHRALVTLIGQELARSQRYGLKCALVFFDIDQFKLLNDSLGHAAGDTTLRELGVVARSALRSMDTIGRWGGDEFVALLPDTDPKAAREVTERLRATIAAHVFSVPGGPHITCSVGVAAYPRDGTTRPVLVEAADHAMYTAKHFGRNQVFAASDPAVIALRDTHPSVGAEEEALAGAVEALALLVDERDANTGGHASQVADLSRRLAIEVGCDSMDTSRIGVAARLHDIGKVAVPDMILLKPAPLNEKEWVFMRKHPVVGSEVLSRIPALRSVAPLVRAHHERWDGSGYPDGLAAEAIPLGARIVSVADAFDAMVVARPYRKAIPVEAAIAEIERCAGTQFDPRVVAAMSRLLHADRAAATGAETVTA